MIYIFIKQSFKKISLLLLKFYFDAFINLFISWPHRLACRILIP